MFLGIVVFLFLLAIFDLVVGVSNDAVNFMNSAIGAKAASFKTIIAIAAFGIFIGATLSNGMMEIARHGIFRPEQFYFQELMCIFLAVMVTDVVLLDIFNSLGMPTSTTVSMVFELLGGTFVLALIKIAEDKTGMLGFADLLNTEKALSVILGIFLSVAVAFFFGTLVQYLSRLLFTFNYTKETEIHYRTVRRYRCYGHYLLHVDKRPERFRLHDCRKQTLDSGKHLDVSKLQFCVLHHSDANTALVQDKCIQGGGNVRYFCLSYGFCRQ